MVEGQEDARAAQDYMDAYGLANTDEPLDTYMSVKDADLMDERIPSDYYYYTSKH
jgi:hypothetical protein